MSKVLVIDDERSIRKTLNEILTDEGFEVAAEESGPKGLERLEKEKFDAVLCDIKMPEMDGLEVLEKTREKGIDSAFIVISGHGTIDTAVEAIRNGAYDFIEKPLDLNRTLVSLRNAIDRSSLVEETKELRKKAQKKKTEHEIIGNSKAIQEVKDMIDKVAPTDARVLIMGGNGSGKELVARQLHEKSQRSKMPFVEVNCAAIPSELIESELFGHEKGAFTSAVKQRKGKFEQADGGTLFLDEVGDMSLSAQSKVLRALQEHSITRVGGDRAIKVDVRVIAATNKHIEKAIEEGLFREDLFHRLNVIKIQVPSLNERPSDIPLLVDHFLDEVCKEQGIPKKAIDKNALEKLKTVNWTGNIRELRNVVERLTILSGDRITEQDVETYV